jgi:hypothetical protein
MLRCVFVFLLFVTGYTSAQITAFYPEDSQVLLYFPHLADGGTRTQQWQTSFMFVNPSTTTTALVVLDIFGNDGNPLSLNVGLGLASSVTFSIPPLGSRTLRSLIASPSIQTGWALAASTSPLQATVLFTELQNGIAQVQISAPATLPSPIYWSPANNQLGVAIVNPFTSGTVNMTLQAIDSQGQTVSQTNLSLGAMQHTSFNAFQMLPNLPSNFVGSVKIFSQTAQGYFLAWTLNADSGVLSSLPPGRAEWPVSHYERIWNVWQRILNAIPPSVPIIPPILVVDYSTGQINSFADTNQNQVHIFINLAELISDSESELGFVVGHEVGHIIQAQTGRLVFVPGNKELDADQYGMVLSLIAGYDPYGAAGVLAKLSMASGDAGLLSQAFDNLNLVAGLDLHGSFDNRLALIFQNMQAICSSPTYQNYCSAYKSVVHPHLPPSAPLSISSAAR